MMQLVIDTIPRFMVVVTLSTVGYGGKGPDDIGGRIIITYSQVTGKNLLIDITASAPSSRIVIILLILITVAVIPSLISDLLDTMQKRDGESGSCHVTIYMWLTRQFPTKSDRWPNHQGCRAIHFDCWYLHSATS